MTYRPCCQSMQQHINSSSGSLGYSPIVREYYLKLRRLHGTIQGIFYCPWCGIKLPSSLRNEYFDTIEQELGIEADLDTRHDPNTPAEFKSDEWWRKRGL